MQKGHVLKYRRACSQIQKGPFFFFNTHALHSCGAKQFYIKIKYSSPSHAFHSPTRFLSTPTPLPFRPQPTLPSPLLPELVHLLPCLFLHTTCSLVSPSTRQLARYSSNLFICYPVSSRHQLVPSSPRLPVNLPVTHRTCSSVTLSPLATNLFPCLPVNSSTYNVTLRPCSPVTMSINTANLFPCPLVNPSSCKLFLSSYFFVGTCPKHCNANSSLFVTHFYRQKITISKTSH